MDMLMGAAAIMAFAPTLLLMYAILKKYTYPAVEQPFFSDPTFFILFSVSLVAGTLLFAFYTYLFSNIIYAIMMAIVEVLVMVVVFNLKRFRGKSDTVFYGYGFGLGMGCTFAFGFIFFIAKQTANFESAVDIPGFIMLFVYGLSFIFTLAAVGTTVGEGIARHRVMEFSLKAILINASFVLVMTASFMSTNSIMMYAGMVAALLLSAGFFYRTMVVNLPGVVRDVLRQEGIKRKVP